MISRFISEVNLKFNPFSPQARAPRLFLSQLPSKARLSGMLIKTSVLPRSSTESNILRVKFSRWIDETYSAARR